MITDIIQTHHQQVCNAPSWKFFRPKSEHLQITKTVQLTRDITIDKNDNKNKSCIINDLIILSPGTRIILALKDKCSFE
jgi:hypothetical protein